MPYSHSHTSPTKPYPPINPPNPSTTPHPHPLPCRKPYHSINFVIAHDGFTLHDLVAYNDKHNSANGESNREWGWAGGKGTVAPRAAHLKERAGGGHRSRMSRVTSTLQLAFSFPFFLPTQQ